MTMHCMHMPQKRAANNVDLRRSHGRSRRCIVLAVHVRVGAVLENWNLSTDSAFTVSYYVDSS